MIVSKRKISFGRFLQRYANDTRLLAAVFSFHELDQVKSWKQMRRCIIRSGHPEYIDVIRYLWNRYSRECVIEWAPGKRA